MKTDFDLWNIHTGAPHAFNNHAPRIDNGTGRLGPDRYFDPRSRAQNGTVCLREAGCWLALRLMCPKRATS